MSSRLTQGVAVPDVEQHILDRFTGVDVDQTDLHVPGCQGCQRSAIPIPLRRRCPTHIGRPSLNSARFDRIGCSPSYQHELVSAHGPRRILVIDPDLRGNKVPRSTRVPTRRYDSESYSPPRPRTPRSSCPRHPTRSRRRSTSSAERYRSIHLRQTCASPRKTRLRGPFEPNLVLVERYRPRSAVRRGKRLL